ncbi:serine/threonine protein kinase [bacterium]|nr:serine/threonine protein kinase [bacterium]
MELTGRIINNRYKIIEKLGEGGMSVVWLAQDTKDDKQIALKVLKEETTSHRVEDIIRFRREATTVSKFLHKNIVITYEIGEYEGLNYIVMELIKGSSLHSLIEEKAAFSQDEVVEIIRGVCNALEYVHNSRVIHRDLKPGNIMIAMGDGSEVTTPCPPLEGGILW